MQLQHMLESISQGIILLLSVLSMFLLTVTAVTGWSSDSGAGSHWASDSTNPERDELHLGSLQLKYM